MVPCQQEHIKALKQNDRLIQQQVFERMYAPMFRVCQRYVVQTDEAEDCLMKGFMKGFQQVDKFEYRDETSFFWWLRRVMVNECLMSLRKKKNFSMVAEDELNAVSVDAEIWQVVDADYLNDLILHLPTGYRTVFCLHVIDGYEHKEIAEMLGISENTSKTQLVKSKNKLRGMLEQNEQYYGNAGK